MVEATQKRKLVVAIPTRDRPAYLHWTVKSVLEQARDHGHDNVEIVISDQSNPQQLALNKELLGRLRKRFPSIPIHHYPTSEKAEPIDRLMPRLNWLERRAVSALMPANGHYGAQRNRLALLAVYHGGPEAAYLHLDDDTPIGLASRSADKSRSLYKKNPSDVLGKFLKAFEASAARGYPGVSFGLMGIKDAARSGSARGSQFRASELTERPVQSTLVHGHEMGPGRLLGFGATILPYKPHGMNEDVEHTNSVKRKMAKAHLYYWQAYEPHFEEDELLHRDLMHVGVVGPNPQHLIPPEEEGKLAATALKKVSRHTKRWQSTARKMAALRESGPTRWQRWSARFRRR